MNIIYKPSLHKANYRQKKIFRWKIFYIIASSTNAASSIAEQIIPYQSAVECYPYIDRKIGSH